MNREKPDQLVLENYEILDDWEKTETGYRGVVLWVDIGGVQRGTKAEFDERGMCTTHIRGWRIPSKHLQLVDLAFERYKRAEEFEFLDEEEIL